MEARSRILKRRCGGRDGGRTPKRRRQHLYLIFDDWSWGYSIRKVDLLSDDDGVEPAHNVTGHGAIDASVNCAGETLPEPVFCMEAPSGYPNYFASAFGTKIVAMHPRVAGISTHPLVPSSFVPVMDVCKRSFGFSPRPKVDLVNPLYFPIDDKLFALCSGSFQLLNSPQREEPGSQGSQWSWHELPKHPFKRRDVTSYTLHPDGRTIFFSTKRGATFTFDTAGNSKWKQDGKWILPFTGRAYYDSKLDSWVGLSGDPGKNGCICACDVVTPKFDSCGGQSLALKVKVSKEKLFTENPAEKHIGANLVYMGGRSRFCLVQCVTLDNESLNKRSFYKLKGTEAEDIDDVGMCSYLLRLTSFALKFDKNGNLTTGNSRRVRYYNVPEVATDYSLDDPVAFWM